MTTGKCPKCDKIIASVTLESVTAGALFGKQWNAISYLCPHCQTVLSVQIDPIALKDDLFAELVDRLRG
ncbi:hypothetical protein LCGC14_0557510 [marine sediment metagenome]|uniref:Uncharacterized protein n=1 Tax=marine sediment metagenome TaxID=412755 RepID=A0A0F9RMZ8_9ZZZZ